MRMIKLKTFVSQLFFPASFLLCSGLTFERVLLNLPAASAAASASGPQHPLVGDDSAADDFASTQGTTHTTLGTTCTTLGTFAATLGPTHDAAAALDTITVSGFADGASFASQFHIAFSHKVSGMASFAGSPYLSAFLGTSLPDIVDETKRMAEDGRIDSLDGLSGDKVYIFQGMLDYVTQWEQADRMKDVYEYMADDINITMKNDLVAEHGFPSSEYGTACWTINYDNYIINCKYSGARAVGQLFYERAGHQTVVRHRHPTNKTFGRERPPTNQNHGREEPPNKKTLGRQGSSTNQNLGRQGPPSNKNLRRQGPTITNQNLDGQGPPTNRSLVKQQGASALLQQFSQAEFFDGDPEAFSMDEIGYVYIPNRCTDDSFTSNCHLHLHFHGCRMGRHFLNESFIVHSSFLEVADEYNVVLLFPQVAPLASPVNDAGCWNWWGYLNDAHAMEYGTQSGKQMAGVARMVESIANIEMFR